MPDIQDVIHVRSQIVALTQDEFRGFAVYKDGRLLCEWSKASDWYDGKEGTDLLRWDRLPPEGVTHLLDGYVDWGGFETADIAQIKANVWHRPDSTRWFEGVSIATRSSEPQREESSLERAYKRAEAMGANRECHRGLER